MIVDKYASQVETQLCVDTDINVQIWDPGRFTNNREFHEIDSSSSYDADLAHDQQSIFIISWSMSMQASGLWWWRN